MKEQVYVWLVAVPPAWILCKTSWSRHDSRSPPNNKLGMMDVDGTKSLSTSNPLKAHFTRAIEWGRGEGYFEWFGTGGNDNQHHSKIGDGSQLARLFRALFGGLSKL